MSRVQSEHGSRAMDLVIRYESGSPDVQEGGIPAHKPRSADVWWIAIGLFLLVLGCYVLTSPGRIDLIDGQVRFDVAYNWLTQGRPVVRDPWVGSIKGVAGLGGAVYSNYGAPASVLSMPLVWLGLHRAHSDIQTTQFLFSLTSPLVGALIAPVLFLIYLELGVAKRSALFWTGVSMFATMIWPSSCTTLDNAQNAFFAVAAVYFALLSARRGTAAYASIGGLAAGVLLLYQEYFVLIIPAMALATLGKRENDAPERFPLEPRETTRPTKSAGTQLPRKVAEFIQEAWREPGDARTSCLRYCWFMAGAGVGLILSLAYNEMRFGSLLHSGKVQAAVQSYPLFGNPLAGFLTVLISPGKSVFLYSPPLVLGILGLRGLFRCAPLLAAAIVTASVTLVLFISCISFAGGDWCWGPRYLTPLLPLLAIAFPFATEHLGKRQLIPVLVGLGLIVQVLALSADNQRFFFQRALPDYFWADDSWFYFKHSALYARVGEAISLPQGPPPMAYYFNSTPVTEWATYASLGPAPGIPRNLSPIWMQRFKIFFLPRPWPLWMLSLPASARPVDIAAWLAGLAGLIGAGAGLVYHGLRKRIGP